MTTILETENKEWGFWGTAKGYLKHKKDMTRLWNETAKLIQRNSGLTPEETQKLTAIWRRSGRMSKPL